MPEQLRVVLAVNIRRRRGELGWTQAELAAAMVAAGCDEWTPATVAGVERLDRPRALALDEVAALCMVMRCRVRDLLAGGGEDVADRLTTRSLESRDMAFQNDKADAARAHQLAALELHLNRVLFPDDYVSSTSRIRDAAYVLYGRDVLAEREARIDIGTSVDTPAGRAQRLGHATRQIITELTEHFFEEDELDE